MSDLIDRTSGARVSPVATNNAQHVAPVMAAGGNISAQTTVAGNTFQSFPPQACKQLTVANNTSTAIEVRQDDTGVAFPVLAGTYYTFFGISNASQLAVRRVDQGATQLTIPARWEA